MAIPTTLIMCSVRGPCVPTHHAIVQLIKAYPEWDELIAGEQGITRARSFSVSKWYKENVDEDVFVMVDDDILFQPTDAQKLAHLCRDGHDIIGAGYPFRDGSSVALRLLPDDTSLLFGDSIEPKEVRHIGTGFMAIHRRVIDAMVPTLRLCSTRLMNEAFWPFFEDPIVVDDEAATGYNWLTEDYSFESRARALGFKVWLDPSILVAHYGHVPVTVTNMAMIRNAIKAAIPEKPALPSPESVAKAIDQAHARQLLADEWHAQHPVTQKEVAEFYRTSSHMAADLHAWHATPARQQWTEIVVGIARQTNARIVVDIGAGAGYELRALKSAGLEFVGGIEPNDAMRSQLEADGFPMLAAIDQCNFTEVDMLVCLDVLEHVIDPESFLGFIAERCKQGCIFVESTATFDHGTPLHLEANHGWTPYACLAKYGWELISAANRVRVWQRFSLSNE